MYHEYHGQWFMERFGCYIEGYGKGLIELLQNYEEDTLVDFYIAFERHGGEGCADFYEKVMEVWSLVDMQCGLCLWDYTSH